MLKSESAVPLSQLGGLLGELKWVKIFSSQLEEKTLQEYKVTFRGLLLNYIKSNAISEERKLEYKKETLKVRSANKSY